MIRLIPISGGVLNVGNWWNWQICLKNGHFLFVNEISLIVYLKNETMHKPGHLKKCEGAIPHYFPKIAPNRTIYHFSHFSTFSALLTRKIQKNLQICWQLSSRDDKSSNKQFFCGNSSYFGLENDPKTLPLNIIYQAFLAIGLVACELVLILWTLLIGLKSTNRVAL